MRRRIFTLSAIILLLLPVADALPETGPAVFLTSGQTPDFAAGKSRRIFPDDTGEIRAYVLLSGREKKKVEFIWYSPSNEVFSESHSLIFPQKDKEYLEGRDRVKVAGKAASEKPGWWRVEVVIDDRKLSRRFLLTKNRLAQVLDTGDRDDKLRYLAGIGPDTPDLKDMVTLALEDGEAEVRAGAIRFLAGRSDGWAMDALAAAQDDPSPLPRAASLSILLPLGGERGRSAAEKAASDVSHAVRKALAEGLAGKDMPYASGLLGRLIADGDSEVRRAALTTLSGMDGDGASGALSEGLAVQDRDFRREVVGTLVRKGGRLRTYALALALKDPDRDIRYTALKALAGVDSEEALEPVRRLLDDPDPVIARMALDVAIAWNDTEGIAAAVRSRHPVIKRLAVDSLSAYHDAASAMGLASAFGDGDADLRKAALNGLRNAGKKGIPGLLTALEDSDPGIREEAAESLLKFGVGKAEINMLAALSDPDEPVRAAALRYFIDRGGPALPGIIEETACDPSMTIRMMGLNALARVPGDCPSMAMSAYLECGDSETKSLVVSALAGREDPASALVMRSAGVRDAAVSVLGAGLNDPDPDTRDKALASLRARRGKETLDALEAYVDKIRDRAFRVRVVGALAEDGLGDTRLVRFMEDGETAVRVKVVEVLSSQEGAEAVYGLLLAGADPDLRVRLLAAKALSGREEGVKDAVGQLFARLQATPIVLGFAAENVRDASALESLVRGVPADDTGRLKAALGPVMARREPSGLPAMVEGCKAEDFPLREALVSSVARVESPETGKALISVYGRYPELKSVVIRVSGEEGHASDIIPLALKDGLTHRREASLYFKALSTGDASVILPGAMGDPDEYVRIAAADAASSSGDGKPRRAAAETYGTLALSGDPGISASSLGSLERLGDDVGSKVWLALAGDPRAGTPARLAALGVLTRRKEPGGARLFAEALGSPDPGLKQAAADGIKALGKPSLSALHPLLKDGSLRPLALRLIKDVGDPSSEGPVLSEMPIMKGTDLALAVDTLGRVGGLGSVGALVSLYNSGNAAMQVAVVKALGGMRLKGDEPGLAEVLSDALGSGDEAMRLSAAAAAGSLKVMALRKTVEARILIEQSSVVKDKLIGALDALWSDVRATVLSALTGGPRLTPGQAIEALDDPGRSARLYALKAAREMPEDKAEPVFIAAVSSAYTDVRNAGLLWLSGRDGPAVVAALEKLLDDPVPDIRRGALFRLIQLRAPSLPDYFMALVKDEDAGIRMMAVKEVVGLADVSKKTDMLLAAVDLPDKAVAETALEGLMPAGDARALPAFERYFRDNHRREEMLSAIAKVPGEAAICTLAVAYRVSSKDEGLRIRAVWALAGRGLGALPVLLEALDDQSGDVRDASVAVVAGVGSPDKVGVLGKALDDRVPEIRLKALAALKKTDGDAATKSINTAINDDDLNIRYSAVDALSSREGAEAAYGLLLAGSDPDERVRSLASRGLSSRVDGVREAVGLVFSRGQATPVVLGFAAENVRDALALESLVAAVPAGDTERLKAVLGPLMDRREPSGLPAMLGGFKGGDIPLKEAIVLAVARVKSPDTGKALAGLYSRYPEFKSLVIRVSGEEGHAGDILPLVLKDGLTLRREASLYFKALSTGDASVILPGAMGDQDEYVRMAAADAALSSGDEGLRKAAAETYGALVLSNDPAISASSLERLGGDVDSRVWLALAGDPKAGVPARLAALGVLARRKEPGGARLFAEALGSPDPGLRQAAADGIKALGKPSLSALHPLVKDGSLRPLALRLIKDIGDPSSEGPVLSEMPVMKGTDLALAVDTLGRVGGPGSVGALVSLYNSGNAAMQAAVVKALGGMRLKGDEPGLAEVLSDALGSGDESIRFYAAHAVGTLKVSSLKGAVESAVTSESSRLIKDELGRALERLTSP